MSEQQPAEAPALRIVTADATPEEIAAVVAVFSAMGGSAPAAPRTVPAWSAYHRRLRPAHPHGPGGWRASGLPR
ncbi:MAG: acyl-CoA carboxylase subunit epsilon [Marmoricola sp.]